MKISCIIATYNGEHFIQDQLDSILNQTDQPDEVLIRDDCSSDSTVEIIQRFILKHSLSHWSLRINTTNMGHRENFTTLLQEATGDVIFLCDQDDVWFDHKVETLVDIMAHDASIALIASNVTPIYTSDSSVLVRKTHIKSTKKVFPLAFSSNWIRPSLPGCSYAIRKHLVDDYLKIWNKQDAHDAILWSVAYVQDSLAHYPESLMNFIRHDHNASDTGKNDPSYRIQSIQSDLDVMRRCIQPLDLDTKKVKAINKQINVYQQRLYILKNRHIIQQIINIKDLRYYARPRFWLADFLYLIRS